ALLQLRANGSVSWSICTDRHYLGKLLHDEALAKDLLEPLRDPLKWTITHAAANQLAKSLLAGVSDAAKVLAEAGVAAGKRNGKLKLRRPAPETQEATPACR